MVKIGLVFNPFKWLDIESYLSLFIRWTVYFKNRGMDGSDTKYNHCFAMIGDIAYEAQLWFRKYIYAGKTSKVTFVTPTFIFDEEVFRAMLEDKVGLFYNFRAIFCQLFYQLTNWKLQKKFYKPFCSWSDARAFYFATKFRNPEIAKQFENYEYMDPQDFVRLWKEGFFKEC